MFQHNKKNVYTSKKLQTIDIMTEVDDEKIYVCQAKSLYKRIDI